MSNNYLKFRKAVTFLAVILSFTACSQKGQDLILEDGSYFDGKKFIPFKELQIKGDQILAISEKKSQLERNRISVKGKFIIPGLIDAHTHISGSPVYPYVSVEPLDNANSSLNCGITTNIDLFYPEEMVKSFENDVNASPQKYSSMLMSGPILTAPGGHGTEYGVPTRTISSVAEAEKITEEVAAKKEIDVIKLVYQAYTNKNTLTKEMVKKIVEVAHRHHKKVFAHIDDAKEAIDCIEAGVDALAHIPYNLMTDAEIAQLKKSGVIVIPTLTVYQSMMEGNSASYMSDSLLWKTAHPDFLASFDKKATDKIPGMDKFFKEKQAYRDNLRNMIKNGIPILAGTDAGNYAVFYGYSLHNEILQYVKEGMTTVEALCSATENISKLLPEMKIGKISPNYNADMVVLNANPIDNIENTKQINFVLHKGKMAVKSNFKLSPPAAAIELPKDVFEWNALTKLPDYISFYTDQMMGGTSTGTLQIEKEQAVNTLHLAGKMEKKGFMGFVGLFINLSKTDKDLPVNLSGYTEVEFEVRGNEESYDVVLGSALVKDYNYHKAPFKPTKEWKKVKIIFSDFKQNPWFGKKINLDLQTITALNFETSLKSCPVDLQIKNIQFIK